MNTTETTKTTIPEELSLAEAAAATLEWLAAEFAKLESIKP